MNESQTYTLASVCTMETTTTTTTTIALLLLLLPLLHSKIKTHSWPAGRGYPRTHARTCALRVGRSEQVHTHRKQKISYTPLYMCQAAYVLCACEYTNIGITDAVYLNIKRAGLCTHPFIYTYICVWCVCTRVRARLRCVACVQHIVERISSSTRSTHKCAGARTRLIYKHVRLAETGCNGDGEGHGASQTESVCKCARALQQLTHRAGEQAEDPTLSGPQSQNREIPQPFWSFHVVHSTLKPGVHASSCGIPSMRACVMAARGLCTQ